MDVAAVGAVGMCVNLEPSGRLSTYPQPTGGCSETDNTEDDHILQTKICITYLGSSRVFADYAANKPKRNLAIEIPVQRLLQLGDTHD